MAKRNENHTGRTIQSVKIAFSIIDVAQRRENVGVTELANELGHSKSTIHSHLQTLVNQEILVPEDDGYRLSLRILDMARRVRDQVGNYDVIEKEVNELATNTNEIAQFGIEEYGRVSYLCKAMGPKAVETASRVGTQQPMYATSLGKTILAYLTTDRQEQIIANCSFERQTKNTISDAEELYDELERITERGYGIDNEENIHGLRCVAAPVQNEDTVLGAISISGPTSRFTDDRLHSELAEQVLRAANVIELNTKFS
ncbi:IclR family transcriptional regulator [Haladaptatus pallidirubidus]|uniref:DNA-binding transcriptional regulator KdgR n=1 Tax=Haladaptatus pallidirubidus TaxID=1008152 RepID=A0AAV3UJ64_9EURY|nr:IclR family transcriptional regulator [Haladaptatus pallidirubidus]